MQKFIQRPLNRRAFLKGLASTAGASAFMSVASWTPAFACGTDVITIGAVVPLTGQLRSFGPRFVTAAEIAVNEVEAAGLGLTVRLEIRDSGTNPEQGVQAASDLVNVVGVPAIFGAAGSGVTIPIATSVTIPNEVVLISPSATSPAITNLDDNDYVFRTAPSDELQGVVLADLAFNGQGYRKVAVVARNDAYGAGLADVFKREFEKLGGTVTNVSLYDPATTDYSAEIAAASDGDPEAISLITFDEGEALITQMVAAGVTNFDLLVDGNKNQDLINRIAASIGTELLEGKVGTGPSAAPTLGGDTFDSLYRAALNEDPFVFTPHSYDALAVLMCACQAAGGEHGPVLRDNIRTVANGPDGQVFTVGQLGDAIKAIRDGARINYEGATGSVAFDANGDPISPIGLWTIQDGKIVDTAISNCAANPDGSFSCTVESL